MVLGESFVYVLHNIWAHVLSFISPYNCEVSDDASGTNFVAMKTLKDVPGTKGRSNAKNAAFPLDIQLPAGTKCSGPSGACLVRCKNGLNQRMSTVS